MSSSKKAAVLLISILICACDRAEQQPETGFRMSLPECVDGQVASVRQRGGHQPNSDLVKVLDEPNGLHACANDGLKGHVQLFLGDFAGACVFDENGGECMQNSDCQSGEFCWCPGVISGANQPEGIWREALGAQGQWDAGYESKCLPIECSNNCAGLGCAVNRDVCGRPIGLRCHTAQDECGATKGFCSDDSNRQQCIFNPSRGHWSCDDVADCG